LLELNENKIITCSGDNKMMIIKLIGENKYQIEQILNAHKNTVCKIIQIKKNELVSISRDKTLKIWILNNKNKFEYITSIYFQNTENDCNILKLNENEFVTSSFKEELLKFWDSNKYSNISTIYSIESYWPYRMMCLLEDDILCVGGMNSKGFYLIKISCHQLIKTITGPKNIFSIYKCFDGNFYVLLLMKIGIIL
jgi:WD40 repeat protein